MPISDREVFIVAASNLARARARLRLHGSLALPPAHPRQRELQEALDAFDNAWRAWLDEGGD